MAGRVIAGALLFVVVDLDAFLLGCTSPLGSRAFFYCRLMSLLLSTRWFNEEDGRTSPAQRSERDRPTR